MGALEPFDTVEIVGMQEEKKSTVVTGVEMFRKLLDEAVAGDNVGCLLRGVDRKAPEYAERNGGYTRIIRTGVRRGDAAETAIIELVK